eukprot:17213-Chlamydomonas_euryale.AAC.2
MREVLEAALLTASALSEGDVLRVDASLGRRTGDGGGVMSDAPASAGTASALGGGRSGSGSGVASLEGDAAGMGVDAPAGGIAEARAEAGGGADVGATPRSPLLFDVLVQELQPGPAVSLIDTDMEAQVGAACDARAFFASFGTKRT